MTTVTDTAIEAKHVLTGKYGEVLAPFLLLMDRELHANADKGDRPGWLAMDTNTALFEIYYHMAKLTYAVRKGNRAEAIEFAADVANMSMMLLDTSGLLYDHIGAPVPESPHD